MKQSLILTGTTCKTEIPFSKIDNLTENTDMHIFKKKKREEENGFILNSVDLIMRGRGYQRRQKIYAGQNVKGFQQKTKPELGLRRSRGFGQWTRRNGTLMSTK